MLFDTLLMTYIGNEVMTGTESLLFSLYESSWMEIREVKHKKSLLIIMENLRRPITIHAYSFKLLLGTLLSVRSGINEVSNNNKVSPIRKSEWRFIW